MTMSLTYLYWKVIHWLGFIDRRIKGAWRVDADRQVRVDYRTIINEADRKQCLHFTREDARREEEVLLPYIKTGLRTGVLDLGCGDGRWAKILAERCGRYVGVDFSRQFVRKARRRVAAKNASFICMPAQEYRDDDSYDYILLIGLLTYLNDEDIVKLVRNCRKMLAKNGKLIVRNVSLGDRAVRRQVYDYRPGALMRLLGDPGYQVIRRNREEELSFFSGFRLDHEQYIAGTGYRLYIFE